MRQRAVNLFHLKRIRYDFFGLVFGAVSREEFPEDFEGDPFDNARLWISSAVRWRSLSVIKQRILWRAMFWIWRTRSRVTLNFSPTSSRVRWLPSSRRGTNDL